MKKANIILLILAIFVFSCASLPEGGNNNDLTSSSVAVTSSSSDNSQSSSVSSSGVVLPPIVIDPSDPAATVETIPDLKLKLKDMPDSLSDNDLKLKLKSPPKKAPTLVNFADQEGAKSYAWLQMYGIITNSSYGQEVLSLIKSLVSNGLDLPLGQVVYYSNYQASSTNFLRIKCISNSIGGLEYYISNYLAYDDTGASGYFIEKDIKMLLQVYPTNSKAAVELIAYGTLEKNNESQPISFYSYYNEATGEKIDSYYSIESYFIWKIWYSSGALSLFGCMLTNGSYSPFYSIAWGDNNNGGIRFVYPYTLADEYYNEDGEFVYEWVDMYGTNCGWPLKFVRVTSLYTNYPIYKDVKSSNIDQWPWQWEGSNYTIPVVTENSEWWFDTNKNGSIETNIDIEFTSCMSKKLCYVWNTNYNIIAPKYLDMVTSGNENLPEYFYFLRNDVVANVSSRLANLSHYTNTNWIEFITNRVISGESNFN